VLFVLPNLFTVSSIFCGLYAILQTVGETPDRFYRAAVAILFAVMFDSLDGRVARLTKTQTDFGIQLDSLADLISFGVAPAILVYQWALAPYGWLGMAAAFGFAVCGAVRLARFNVLATSTTRPSHHFVGLPIPLAAAGLVSLVLLHARTGAEHLGSQYLPFLAGVVVVLSLLMVSTIPYRTFKKLRANRRTVPIVIVGIGGVLFAASLTSFSLMFVVVTAGMISAGLAEGLLGLVLRHRQHADIEESDAEDEREEEPAG
jgi:CDP-diacylglycerol--serine O-phosphatidyltransferase